MATRCLWTREVIYLASCLSSFVHLLRLRILCPTVLACLGVSWDIVAIHAHLHPLLYLLLTTVECRDYLAGVYIDCVYGKHQV